MFFFLNSLSLSKDISRDLGSISNLGGHDASRALFPEEKRGIF